MARKRKLEEPALRNPAAIYLDAEGNRTEDPALAVRGEVVEHDE